MCTHTLRPSTPHAHATADGFVPRYVRGHRPRAACSSAATSSAPTSAPAHARLRTPGTVLLASPCRAPSRTPSASKSTSAAIASAPSFFQQAHIEGSSPTVGLSHLIAVPSSAPAATSSMPTASPILYWPRDVSPGRSGETDDDELMPQQPARRRRPQRSRFSSSALCLCRRAGATQLASYGLPSLRTAGIPRSAVRRTVPPLQFPSRSARRRRGGRRVRELRDPTRMRHLLL